MVKVKDDVPMAESKPAETSSTTPLNNVSSNNTSTSNSIPRKPRLHHHSQVHPPFHHFIHHHHCPFPPPECADACSANGTTPAKFYFGPGFEPQRGRGGGCYGPGPSQRNEYVVSLHVNPGVTINFQMGDSLEILRGPVTIPLVSTNQSPPVAMPVQVPPGHVVQQIVDENGTLRHVILSASHHPPNLVPLPSHNPQHYGAGPGNGTNQSQQYYPGLPTGFPPQHFHSNMQPGNHPVPSPTHMGHSPPPNPTYYKDERTQRQHIKLKKKLHEKQQNKGDLSPRKELVNGLKRTATKEKGMNSVGTSEDGEESSVPDEEDSIQIITDILSSVQAPKVSELSSRSALLQWAQPIKLSESASNDSHEVDISESDLRYEVLLSDKSKEMKFKSIYNGASLSCRIQDLKPGQEYSVCLQVHLDELQGSATDPIKFTTPPCEPDQPQPPKLNARTKNSLQLRWNQVNDNGAHILYYILEYDEGKGGDFVEIHKSRSRPQYNIQKLTPATSYRFRMAVVNEVGKSAYSETVVYKTYDNPPTQPDPPILVEASVSSLHVQWNRRPKDEEFTLQMDDTKTKYGLMNVYNGRDNFYVCQRLSYYNDYIFRLRASNEDGMSPWSEEVTYRTLPDRPGRPSKPVVKGRIHAYSFKLKWEPPSETGGAEITRYILEVNSGSGYETVYSGTETEAICDKLTPGTTYQLRVNCISAGGSSNYSDPCTVTTDAISPGQCGTLRLHGKPKANSITIRWTEPDYNGGAPVLDYEVEMVSPDSSRSIVHKNKETECTVTDEVKPGCDYVFTVRAVNRIGPGPWSDTLRVTSGAAPPNVPLIPSVQCKSPFHIYIEWQEPPSNGASVNEYRLEMSPSNEEEKFSCIYQGPQQNYDLKGLNPFHTYYFRVQAGNSAGFSNFSPVAATITPAAPPSIITTLRSKSTPTSISLYWNPPASNGSEITHYNIEIGDRMISTESASTEYVIQNLHPETHYKIKIQAVNAVANGPFSSTVRTSTLRLPPAAPSLECVGVGHNYLKLKWGEGKNLDYTQYCVQMESPRTHDFQLVYKGTALTCKVNKLHEVTAYKFKINASNDAGDGEFSNVYEFSTSISPPAALKLPKCEVDQRTCILEWIPSKNSFSDAIIYQVQLARQKEQVFKQAYKGSETKCVLENLEPGVEYSTRVCPIRITSNGELPGPSSSVLNFTTTLVPEPSAVTKLSPTSSNTALHAHRGRSLHQLWHTVSLRKFCQEYQVYVYAVLIMILGIIISLGIASFL